MTESNTLSSGDIMAQAKKLKTLRQQSALVEADPEDIGQETAAGDEGDGDSFSQDDEHGSADLEETALQEQEELEEADAPEEQPDQSAETIASHEADNDVSEKTEKKRSVEKGGRILVGIDLGTCRTARPFA